MQGTFRLRNIITGVTMGALAAAPGLAQTSPQPRPVAARAPAAAAPDPAGPAACDAAVAGIPYPVVLPASLAGLRPAYNGESRMAAFAASDANGDLRLELAEIATLAERFRLFARDRNGDGHVSLQEYLDSSGSKADVTVDRVTTIGLIAGASEQTAQPVEVIGREQLEARGSPPMEGVIRDLSAVGNVQGQSARGTNAGGYGVSSIDLRNLGAGRTVLTLNGRRIADGPAPGGGATFVGGAPEDYPAFESNPRHMTADEPVSTFSIDVDTASYANVRRFLAEGRRPPADAVRVEEMINYFDYGYVRPSTRNRPFNTFVAVAPSPFSPGKQLMHVGVQGYKPAPAARPPLNLVFLVDTSGSMSPADRLPLAKQALNILVDQMRDQDRVALVTYAGSAGVALPPTTGAEKDAIRRAIDRLGAGGSTAGAAGLSRAYALARDNFDEAAVNRVILMTDGDFNVGVTANRSLEDYVACQRQSGVYLSVYGFGRGNYQDARMQTLAQNGNGTAAYIDTVREAARLFRDDFEGSMFPIANDVKIQVEFNPDVVVDYRLIGYETRLLAREDFDDDTVDAGEVGAGVAVTALYEITPAGMPIDGRPLGYDLDLTPFAPVKEIATLKVRYKLPGRGDSQLMMRTVDAGDVFGRLEWAPPALRWATAVAAYGQKLRGDPAADRFTWDETLKLAQGAHGTDPHGLREEFIRLVRTARDLQQTQAGL